MELRPVWSERKYGRTERSRDDGEDGGLGEVGESEHGRDGEHADGETADEHRLDGLYQARVFCEVDAAVAAGGRTSRRGSVSLPGFDGEGYGIAATEQNRMNAYTGYR